MANGRKSSKGKVSGGRAVARLAREHGQTWRETRSALELTAELIRSELQTHGVFRLRNVGTFRVHALPARIRRNPQTGEQIHVAAKGVVRFKPTKALSDAIA